MHVSGGVGGHQQEGILRGAEDRSMLHTYVPMVTAWCNPPSTVERAGKGGCNNGGVSMFKVHRMHVWNYHNKIPPILLMYDNSKIK
jgi:hypothetical protein